MGAGTRAASIIRTLGWTAAQILGDWRARSSVSTEETRGADTAGSRVAMVPHLGWRHPRRACCCDFSPAFFPSLDRSRKLAVWQEFSSNAATAPMLLLY